MKKHNIRTAVLSCLALVLVISVHIAPSLSYFTTYVTAQGGYPIRLRMVDTDMTETFVSEKEITIKNTGEQDCYVRVRVLAGALIDLNVYGDGWSALQADGYYYYSEILKPGETASLLHAGITRKEGLKDQDYNVVVVEECTPVQYDANGQPYADWTMSIKGGN